MTNLLKASIVMCIACATAQSGDPAGSYFRVKYGISPPANEIRPRQANSRAARTWQEEFIRQKFGRISGMHAPMAASPSSRVTTGVASNRTSAEQLSLAKFGRNLSP